MPNEYGISKHPLFFLQRIRKPKSFDKQLLLFEVKTILKDVSSAIFHEDLEI
jgi:hypothetical protein